MKIKLTLQEKLRDLRDEQVFTPSMLIGNGSIPLAWFDDAVASGQLVPK
jgi:hypothetical protein